MTESVVSSNGVDLAVRDHGGSGPSVVLLHGGGRDMDDWRLVVPALLDAGLRVVTADLRGYGRSGPALWSWPDAVADLAAVIADRRLVAPAVVGHSLGGMVAAVWATTHPECPLAVNLDGHTNPMGPYDGLGPAEADAARRTMRTFLDTSLERAADPALTHLVAEFDTLDLFATYAATRCPLVVVSAARLGAEELLPAEVARVLDAYRRGFDREVARIAAVTPLLSLVDTNTGHDIPLEAPDEVVRLITRALALG